SPSVAILVLGLLLVPLAVALIVDASSRTIGLVVALAAVALVALSMARLRRTIDFHEHGLRLNTRQLLYRDIERMRVDVVRAVRALDLYNGSAGWRYLPRRPQLRDRVCRLGPENGLARGGLRRTGERGA